MYLQTLVLYVQGYYENALLMANLNIFLFFLYVFANRMLPCYAEYSTQTNRYSTMRLYTIHILSLARYAKHCTHIQYIRAKNHDIFLSSEGTHTAILPASLLFVVISSSAVGRPNFGSLARRIAVSSLC